MMVGYQKEKALPFLAWTLVKIGDQRFLDEHCSLAQGAAAQLARAHNPSYLRALFVILRNRTCLVEFWEGGIQDLTRECAFAAIGPYGEDALPYLHPLLRDNDPYVRRNAAFTLGIFLDDAGKPMFLDMLAAKDVAAGGAAFALGELGATEAGGRIAPLLGSAEPTTRLCAAHALGKMGIRGALPALEAAAAVEKDWRTQAEMEAAIREIQSPAQPLGSGCRKLDPRELEVALADAERNPGIFLDVAEVAASAGPQELAQMKKIRLKLLREEWKGCKLGGPFWVWTDAIKEVKKRR
jgi:HEAT repeat protein